GLVDRRVANHDRLRPHGVARRRAGDQQVADLNGAIARVDLDLHAADVRNLYLVVATFSQNQARLVRYDTRHARVIGLFAGRHLVRLGPAQDHDRPGGKFACRRYPFGHVLILRSNVAVDLDVAGHMEHRAWRNRPNSHVAGRGKDELRAAAVRVESERHVRPRAQMKARDAAGTAGEELAEIRTLAHTDPAVHVQL